MRIVEVVDRDEQGRTRPFLCRGQDGSIYFVKGEIAGYRTKVAEWIAGRLAQELSLPVVPFEIVEVPGILIRESLFPQVAELGVGEAFGSLQVESAADFEWGMVNSVDPGLAAQVLAFDWWIANEDRALGPLGGNVNLLWTPPTNLHVLDHNNAFSESTANTAWGEFCDYHVFGQWWQNTLPSPLYLTGPADALESAGNLSWSDEHRSACRNFGPKCQSLITKVPDFWDEMPDTWQERCTTLDLEAILAILNRADGILWRTK